MPNCTTIGDELALRLQVDGVIIESDHALHLARQQRGRRLRAGGRVEQLDVQSLFLEEAELGCELCRKVNLLVDAADHDLDRGLRLRGRYERGRYSGEDGSGENLAHGVSFGFSGRFLKYLPGAEVPQGRDFPAFSQAMRHPAPHSVNRGFGGQAGLSRAPSHPSSFRAEC